MLRFFTARADFACENSRKRSIHSQRMSVPISVPLRLLPKSEARNPKSETNSKSQIRNPRCPFRIWEFGFRICFGFRYSTFGFLHGLSIPAFQFSLDVARDQLDREQVADAADIRVLFEAGEIGEGHAGAQLG